MKIALRNKTISVDRTHHTHWLVFSRLPKVALSSKKMPAHKGGYGCYAIVCSTFLIIFGFGLGFIVGYFVLNKPVVKKPALSSRYITESKGLHLLEEVANNTQFDYPETEFA